MLTAEESRRQSQNITLVGISTFKDLVDENIRKATNDGLTYVGIKLTDKNPEFKVLRSVIFELTKLGYHCVVVNSKYSSSVSYDESKYLYVYWD